MIGNISVSINRLSRCLILVSAVGTLTGCDYFADNWSAKAGRCQSISSSDDAVAMVSKNSVAFMRLESGCPANLDLLGTRFTNIDINGDRYRATLVCNDRTQNRTMILVGIPDGIPGGGKENATSVLAAPAMKAFTSFTGAKVTIEGKSFSFSKGNFTKACRAYLPGNAEQPHSNGSAPAQVKTALTLGDLQAMVNTQRENNTKQAIHPPVSPVATETAKPTKAELTSGIYERAFERAKSTWLLSHPNTDLSELFWEKTARSDKELNGEVLQIIRYTTTNPVTGIVSDVDVEVHPDGQVGYAINNDRPGPPPVPTRPISPQPAQASTDLPINAFCTLNNGKNVGVYAAPGQDYHYTYTNKNDQSELELKEGLFGVKAFHYYTSAGMGSASYIRFNKGVYDYILLSKDTGHEEFQGIRVYKNGDLISSHECKTKLVLDTSNLPKNTHFDDEKMGDYFTSN